GEVARAEEDIDPVRVDRRAEDADGDQHDEAPIELGAQQEAAEPEKRPARGAALACHCRLRHGATRLSSEAAAPARRNCGCTSPPGEAWSRMVSATNSVWCSSAVGRPSRSTRMRSLKASSSGISELATMIAMPCADSSRISR